ncbi:MAG: class I SAM-dependent methyltransferase [Steroidobacteraceae bacterium]
MRYVVCTGAALALCAAAGASFAASAAHHHHHHMAVPAYITTAVNDSTRPESDRMRDVNRKPAEVLAFAGIKPGEKIGELMPAQGYYTRLLCRVVGDSGHVYGVNFQMHMPPPPPGAPPRPRRARPAPAPLGCDNVTDTTQSAGSLTLPSDLDVVWTTENYHDFHNAMLGSPDMMAFDMAVYNALKPGGEFIIEDHAAAAGTGTSDTNTLHRIDPAQVKKEVEAVGFKFAGQSNVLRNPKDNHTEIVFKMADKTDRFLFKFRKPGA